MNPEILLDSLNYIDNDVVYRLCTLTSSEGIIAEELIVSNDTYIQIRNKYPYRYIYINRLIYSVPNSSKTLYLDEHRLIKYIESNLSFYIYAPNDTIDEFRTELHNNGNQIASSIMCRMKKHRLTLKQVLNQYLRQEIMSPIWKSCPNSNMLNDDDVVWTDWP